MYEVMYINPKTKRRSRRRPMTALQRKYFGKRGSRSPRRTVRVTHARRNPSAVATRSAAPVRRRRRSGSSSYIVRTRRNVASGIGGFISRDLMPAAIGAGGALALDMIWPHLTFLPEQLQTGPFTPVVRVAGAVGLGLVVGMVGGSSMGKAAMVGALTVTVYDIAKGYLADNVPPPAPAPSTTAAGYAPRSLGWINPARDAGAMRGYAPMGGYAPAYG